MPEQPLHDRHGHATPEKIKTCMGRVADTTRTQGDAAKTQEDLDLLHERLADADADLRWRLSHQGFQPMSTERNALTSTFIEASKHLIARGHEISAIED